METRHHYQRVDTETGYLIATREDTPKYQDLDIKEYTPEGILYFEKRVVYNIQYAYIRSQEWLGDKPICDAIHGMDHYGHLQYEYTEGGYLAPSDWVNPYPDNHEPVRPEGADIFHTEGISFSESFALTRIGARANFYIYEDLDDFHKPDMTNLITQVRPSMQWVIDEQIAYLQKALETFDPIEAVKQRFKQLRKHSKMIGVTIPYDPMFMD